MNTNYNNDFEARYATYLALGGEPKEFANIFEVDLAILEIIQQGIGGDFKTNHYMDADGRLIVERGEDGRTVISDEHENPIIERLADGTTKIFDAYQGERMTITANGNITFQELTTLGNQVASNTQAIQAIAASGGASTAEAVLFTDGENLAIKSEKWTKKIRVDIVPDGTTYKFMLGEQELNFADLNRMLQETPDFVVFVYDNREHRCVRIELDGSTKFMEFTSPIIEGVNTKAQSFLVTSINGTQIFTVKRTDIINENISNKSNTLDLLPGENPEVKYPSVKAVNDAFGTIIVNEDRNAYSEIKRNVHLPIGTKLCNLGVWDIILTESDGGTRYDIKPQEIWESTFEVNIIKNGSRAGKTVLFVYSQLDDKIKIHSDYLVSDINAIKESNLQFEGKVILEVTDDPGYSQHLVTEIPINTKLINLGKYDINVYRTYSSADRHKIPNGGEYITEFPVTVIQNAGSRVADLYVKSYGTVDSIIKEHIRPLEEKVPVPTMVFIGDSITQGAGASVYNNSYASRVGNEFTSKRIISSFKNLGSGGKTSADIAAYTGASVLKITNNITIPTDNTPVAITINKDVKTPANTIQFNPVFIAGVKGNMSYSGNSYYFTKSDDYELTTSKSVSAGEHIITDGAKKSLYAEYMVIFVGTNDHTDEGRYTKEELMENIKRLSKLSRNGKYVILSPYVASVSEELRDMISAEYGARNIDMYQYMTTQAVTDAVERGYITSSEGTWQSLLLTDGTHPNDAGHHLIADLVIERFNELYF